MKVVLFGGGGLVGTRFKKLQKDNFDIINISNCGFGQ